METGAMRLAAFLTLVALVGCGGKTDTTGGCVEGKQDECGCIGGGTGIQICNDQGKWGPCLGCGTPVDFDANAWPDNLVPDTVQHVDPGPQGEDAWIGPDNPFFKDNYFVSEVLPPEATPTEPCDPCGYGSLKGLVCAPDEMTFIPNALVTVNAVDCDGKPKQFQTYTDADGAFYYPKVPCGLHQVDVTAGSFATSYAVLIQAGQETDVSELGERCFGPYSAKIAVLWGQWDEFQDLLFELGLQYDWYGFKEEFYDDTPWEDIEAFQLLLDPAKLDKYDIIFFNCGSVALDWINDEQIIRQNVKNFVLAGGSIYASDLSWAYVEGTFPDAIDFWGEDDLPSMHLQEPQIAEGQQDVPSVVMDPVLASYVGLTSFTAKYGAGPLIHVDEAGEGTQVHIQGTVKLECDSCIFPKKDSGPLVMSFTPAPGAGRAIFTTFHNDEQADELILKILHYLVFLL